MGDKTVNIRIESLFNDAGFSRAVRAVRTLQEEIGRANAGMRQMAEMARDVSSSMNQAATSTANLGRDIQAASTKVNRFVTNAQKASEANRDLGTSANQAAQGVNNLERSLVVASTSAVQLVEQAGSGSRALAVLGNSARTLSTATQTAGRANSQFTQGLRALYAGTIDVEARFVGATQGARMLGDGIHALGAGSRETVGNLRMLQEGARVIDNGMRMLGAGTRQATQNIIEAQFRIVGATQATRNFGSVFGAARQGISSFTSLLRTLLQGIGSLNRTVSGSAPSFQMLTNAMRGNLNTARQLIQQYQRYRQQGASVSATLSTLAAHQLRNHQAALRMMQGLQGVFSTISRVNNIASRLGQTLARSLTNGIMRAVRSIGQLLSAGARFAGLRSSLDATGRSAQRFGADFEKGMNRANRSAMEFYAAGWSLIMGGQMVGGFGRRMLGGITGQLDQFLDYEQARTKLAIASSGLENPGASKLPINAQNQLIDQMIFGLQRGEYGNAIPMSAPELAQGAYFYASALGTPITNKAQADQLARSLAPILSVASYTQTSPETAIKGVLNAAMEFGYDPRAAGSDKDLARIAGQFGYLTQASTLELPDIVQTFKMMGPMVNELGGTDNRQNLNDAMLMTFLASEMGLRGSQVGRGLNQAMNSLLSPTDKMNSTSQDLFGGDVESTFFDDNLHLKGGLTGFLSKFIGLDEGEWQKALADLFTTNATRSLIPIIEQLRNNPEKALDFMKNMEGDAPLALTDAAMERYNASIQGHLTQVKNAWFEVQSAIVESIQGPFKKALDGLKRLFQEVADVINDHPAIAKFFTVLTAGIGVVLSVVGSLLTMAGTLLIIRRAFMMTHGAVTILIHVLTALPAIFAIGLPLILALAAAAVLLQRAWRENFLGIQDIVARFTSDFSGAVDPLLDRLELIARRVSELFAGFVNAQFDRFVAWLPSIRDELNAVLAVLVEFGKGAVEGVGASFLVIAAAVQQMIRVLRQAPSALKWIGQTVRDLTGLNVTVEQTAHALGVAFGVVMAGLAVRSLRVFNNEVTRGTLHLVRFIATNVLLRGLLLTFQGMAAAAQMAFLVIARGAVAAIAPLQRLIATQLMAAGAAQASAATTILAWAGVVIALAAVGVAIYRLWQTNDEFRANVLAAWASIKNVVVDFAQGALAGLVTGLQIAAAVGYAAFITLVALFEQLALALSKVIAPLASFADGGNRAYVAGYALGVAIGVLVAKIAVDLVASIVLATAKILLMAAAMAVQAVTAVWAWIAALGPLGIALAGMVVAAAAVIAILDHFGLIQDPFKTIKDSANVAIGAVSLLFDWLTKTNAEQARADQQAAVKKYDSYVEQRYARAQQSATDSHPMDVSAFALDPALQSAYLLNGGDKTPKAWLESQGISAVYQNPDDYQSLLKQRYTEQDNLIEGKGDNGLARSFTGTPGGGSSGPTGVGFLDDLISQWSVDRVLKTLGINMPELQSQISGLSPTTMKSYDDYDQMAKDQAKKLFISKRYRELTGQPLPAEILDKGYLDSKNLNEYVNRNFHTSGFGDMALAGGMGANIDTEALQQATDDYTNTIADGAEANAEAFQAFSDSFYSAIQTIDLPSALKGIFDSSLGQGGTSAATVLGTYADTIMTNLQNTVGTDVKLPWQNSFELMMDAAGSGASLGQNLTGKNLHKALLPYIDTFAAQSGVDPSALLADIPKFYAPEQYLGMGQADLIQAAQLLPTDMYKRLDTLGAGQYNANGLDWQELANFGTAQAASGNLNWNLADYLSEAWDIGKKEAEDYIKAHQLDPNVITGQDFFDTKLYADSLGGKVNVMTEDWWNYVQEVTKGGADKTIEITQSAFDALPDAIKIGMSNMGYQFVIGGDGVSQDAVRTAEAIKKHIEDTFGNIPDHLGKLLEQGWTAVDSDMDGLVEIRDELGNLKFTIPAGDYQAWIESNDILQKEERRLRRLKNKLVELKEDLRGLQGIRDNPGAPGSAPRAGIGFIDDSTGQTVVPDSVFTRIDTLKTKIGDIRTDLGWITGEGGTPPQIDVAGMMPSSDDIKKLGAQAATDFKTGFDSEFATIGDGTNNFKVKITLDREEMLSRLVDTQVLLMGLDDETYTAKIDVDRTDATTHYNEMVTALRDDYDSHTWTTDIDIDQTKAHNVFATVTTNLNVMWATKTWTTTLAVTDNASVPIGLAIGLAAIGFAKTFTATLALKDYATYTLQTAVNLLNSLNGRTATMSIVTNHVDNYGGLTANAQGGMMFRGGLSMVGEYGPELVYLGAGSRVIPNNLSMLIMQSMVNRSVSTMVGTRGGYQSHSVGAGSGSAGGQGDGDFVVNLYGDNHFHNETDMDQLVERLDTFYGRRVEMLKRGQYGGDSARHRTT